MANENRAQNFIASKVMEIFARTLDTNLETLEVDGEKELLHAAFEMNLNQCLMTSVDIFMASLSPEMKLKFMEFMDEDEMFGNWNLFAKSLPLRKFFRDFYDDDGNLR